MEQNVVRNGCFKRRVSKGNFRAKRNLEEDSIEESEDVIVDKEFLEELRLVQSFRKRRNGIDAVELVNRSSSKLVSDHSSTAEFGALIMGSQFSQAKSGVSEGPVAHEKIMHVYVAEKLGNLLGATKSEPEPIPLTEEEKLYRIPDEIKALEGRKVVADVFGKDDSIGAGATGLAEVSLPIEFKLKNIEETEAARRQMEQQRTARCSAPGESRTLALGTATARLYQQNAYSKPRQFPGGGSVEVPKQSQSGPASVEQDGVRLPKGMQRSSDDMAMDRFKKRERNMRR